MKSKPIFNYPLFALGFRPFFVLAGLSALVLILLWMSILKGSILPANYYVSTTLWHAHEMLLGFAVAVIAGFLLTAVKNWTGIATLGYDKLAGLCLLWIYGRVAPFYHTLLPDMLIAAIDFSFLPCLIYFVTKPIIRSRNFNNLVFSAMLLLIAMGNAMIHSQLLGISEKTAFQGLHLIVAVIISMILVVAGRVFPFFTERGLTSAFSIRNPLLDLLAVLAAILAFALMLAGVSGFYMFIAALLAICCNFVRIKGWYDARIWYVPLLWVLYAGLGWILLGFAMLALNAYQIVSISLAMHAFSVGGIGVLTLGMMARVSLGHTGRALKASNVIALAFMLINIAALFRAALPAIFPDWYSGFIYISSYCWLTAFALFVLYYRYILTTPRIDGHEG